MYKSLYQRFLQYHPHRLHFACHSHHYWPDVTREAQLQYWDDSARWVDKKWGYFYSEILPKVVSFINAELNISAFDNIVFAPNTHELVFRLLSSFDWKNKFRVLTTDSEFYSFQRQITRLEELGVVEVIRVPTEPFATFEDRFLSESLKQDFHLAFFSQVFFNSGFKCDYDKIINNLPPKTKICLDGYHGFMACPTDLKDLSPRCYYIAGGYKYAQGGEGACFMVVPPSEHTRPFYTGWFAELSTLHNKADQVPYPTSAQQFAGSTMDFSAIYRLRSVLELFYNRGLTSVVIDDYIKKNMTYFLEEMDQNSHPLINRNSLRMQDLASHGHFFTFELPTAELTEKFVQALELLNLETDFRKNRIRFGFGLYQNKEDIQKAWHIIKSCT